VILHKGGGGEATTTATAAAAAAATTTTTAININNIWMSATDKKFKEKTC